MNETTHQRSALDVLLHTEGDLKQFAERLDKREGLPPGYQVGWLDFDEAQEG